MAFENIQIEQGNFTLTNTGTSFFTLDHGDQQLTEKTSGGVVIFNYLLDVPIIEVQSLQFDGIFFWSLERQSTAGFRVRKWSLGSDNILHVEDEFSFITDVINKFDVNSMAVESYSDTLDNPETVGTTTFDVVDGSIIRVGDRIAVGPSTAVGFEGNISFTTVVAKPSSNTITVSPPLDTNFSPNDPLYFSRSFFVFSDTAPANLPGALYKFRTSDGFPLALNVNNIFANVTASTFFQGNLLFVKGGEIIWLDPDSQGITKSQAIDNLDEDRGEYHTAYDLTAFSNTIYRLEQKHVFLSGGSFQTEDWSPLYNYNTSGTVPEVYFVAGKAEPPLLHKAATGVPVSENKSAITVTVLDQFRTPVFNRVVDFTTTAGSLSSTQETTDTNGQVSVEYTADSNLGEVTITVTVT